MAIENYTHHLSIYQLHPNRTRWTRVGAPKPLLAAHGYKDKRIMAKPLRLGLGIRRNKPYEGLEDNAKVPPTSTSSK